MIKTANPVVYSPFSRNEVSKDSQGGTEITTDNLEEYLKSSPVADILDNFQFITSRVRDLDQSKIRILHLHDLAEDPEAAHLKDPESRNKFHATVYVSNWQEQMFNLKLGVPNDQKAVVIENGVKTFSDDVVKEDQSKIRLIYTSTPQRGLNILIPVFEKLAETNPNIVLDVYSSFEIYGWPQRDEQFKELFQRCHDHPQINYHGFRPQEDVRAAYQKADIFAYPCTWQETSCRTLIEAMMSDCLCVHPNYGALAETSGGLTTMYQYMDDINVHADIFYKVLEGAINRVKITREDEEQRLGLANYLTFVKNYANVKYSWETFVGPKWVLLLKGLHEAYHGKDLSFQQKMFSVKTS